MGADATMYTDPWRDLPDARFLDWSACTSGDTLGDFADQLISAHRIPAGSTLIGTSLGGMVACEIAPRIRARHLILIGSATHPSEINTLLSRLHPLARYTPLEWLQFSAASVPGELAPLASMFARSRPEFLRSAIPAIFRWSGLPQNHPSPLRIHGRSDRVIPPPPNPDHLLDGGHLITMTHADQCCDAITRHLFLAP